MNKFILNKEIFNIFLLSSFISIGVFSINWAKFEGVLYNYRMSWLNNKTPLNNIITIGIDQNDLNAFKTTHFDILSIHNKILQKINKFKPHAILFLYDFNKILQYNQNPEDLKQSIVEFQMLYQKTKHIYWGTFFEGDSIDITHPPSVYQPYVIPALVSAVPDILSAPHDSVVRRSHLYSFHPTATYLIAQSINHIHKFKDYQGSFDMNQDNIFIRINYVGPQNTFKILNTQSMIKDSINFDGKIVIIGYHDLFEDEDYALTPYNDIIWDFSKLEIQANILQSLILNNGIKIPPEYLVFTFSYLMAFILLFYLFHLEPNKGFILIVLAFLLMTLLSCLAWVFFDVAIQLSPIYLILLCIWILGYPIIAYQEVRKRIVAEEDIKVIKKIDEMKNNFLNLISHDLKTPIAKMQLNLESIARTVQETLMDSEKKQKILKDVIKLKSFSNELSEFITSIMTINTIENKGVKLNLQDKDINDILQNVLKKLKFEIATKNIKITKDFEPIFPIPIDANLIEMVFKNIIDNAIKYNNNPQPEIYIATKEIDHYVQITIEDNGAGIEATEMNNLFQKFYRIKNNLYFEVPGSGLGLYLSQYFVNLHGGQIKIESEINKGTLMIITLPFFQEKIENHHKNGEPHV